MLRLNMMKWHYLAGHLAIMDFETVILITLPPYWMSHHSLNLQRHVRSKIGISTSLSKLFRKGCGRYGYS